MAKVEALGANKVKLTVEVSADEFAAALQQAYLKNRGNFSIQGFRKGKAPKPVIESHYGEGIFYEDALDIVFPDSYAKAVEESKIEPVSRPTLDVTDIGKKQGVVYTAEVFVKPEVELGEYKGIKAEQVTASVTDQQVEDEIARAAERNARWVEADRAAADKDKVIIDYSGSVDGEKFEGGTAENQAIELGSGTFIPGFEEQIVGMKRETRRTSPSSSLTITVRSSWRARMPCSMCCCMMSNKKSCLSLTMNLRRMSPSLIRWMNTGQACVKEWKNKRRNRPKRRQKTMCSPRLLKTPRSMCPNA